MTDRQIGVFMTFNLLKQGYEWGSSLTGMNNQKMKHRFQISMNANRNLITEMELELSKEDPEHIEQFWNDSEVFSKCLEVIRKSPIEKKQDLFIIMKEFANGNLTVKEETL